MEKHRPLSYQEFLLKCGDDERVFVNALDTQQKRLKENIRTFNNLIHRAFGLFVLTDRGFDKEEMGEMIDDFAKAADMMEVLHRKVEQWNKELEETARENGLDA